MTPKKRTRRPGRQQKPVRSGLPNRDELLTFIAANGSANRRDIAREFGLRGAQRAALRTILRELEDEGLL
ncbi:MAG: hypothetical protein ACTSWM_01775, partial [Alphaproteobacteria bacterium]